MMRLCSDESRLSHLVVLVLSVAFMSCTARRDPVYVPIPGYEGPKRLILFSPIDANKLQEEIPYSPHAVAGYADTVRISMGTHRSELRTYHYVDSDDRLVYISMTFTSPRDSLLAFLDRYVGVLRSHKWSINEKWREEYVGSSKGVLGYYKDLPLTFVVMNFGNYRNESDIEVTMDFGTP